ncbi:MAG: 50S ribosomal protein L21 [Planctomycetes bacterium]|nr:50S ribosomal protein L21 [Planctomycetota bacterium]
MIAIIRDGGKQYRVSEGDTVAIERREAAPGSRIEFSEVLSIEEGERIHVGKPLVAGARVVAEVLAEAKGPKVRYHHFRRREGSHTRAGHRQVYTQVRIESIQAK